MASAWLLLAWHALSVITPLLIAFTFARTLRAGQRPLITRIADAARGPLDAGMQRYTRRLTLFWAVTCAGLASLNLLLMLQARSVPLWVAALLPALSVPLLFVMEYLYRRWRFPAHDHPGFLEYLRIIRKHYRK